MATSSKYYALVEVQVDPKQMKSAILTASKSTTISPKINLGSKQIGEYVKQWNNQIARMEFKSPDIFKSDKVKSSLATLRTQIADFSSGGATSVKDVRMGFDDLKTSMAEAGAGMKNVTKDGYDFSTMVGVALKKIAIWGISTQLLYGSLKEIGNGIQYIKDLDKELTNVQIVTGMTAEETEKLSKQYNQLAKNLGATTLEVARGSLEWFRQGKTVEETSKLMEETMKMSKLGNLESAQSTEYLTSIMNGFKLEAEDVSLVVDKLVGLDNNMATSVSELATALQYSSNSAQQAGVSFEELASYVAVISSTTRRSAESIGQSLKTMFARLENIKLGKMFEDDATTLSDVEQALSLVDIQLRETADTFRPMGDVLDEISTKWEDMSEVEQSAVANAIAGKNRMPEYMVTYRDCIFYN